MRNEGETLAIHNRLVKADLWRSTDLIRAVGGDPFGLQLYQGLWHMADDSGCLPDDELLVKIELFAGFDVVTTSRIRELMDALIAAGKMVRYEVRGRTYLWLTNFHRHQTLDYPRQAEYPLPEWIQWEEGESRGQSRFLIFADKCPVELSKDARRGFVVVTSSEAQRLANDNTMTKQRHDTESVSISISSSNTRERGESEGREGETEQKDKPPYREIVAYLNEKAGTGYRATSEKTRRLINARWNEGYRLEDFIAVIDVKVSEWLGTEQAKYLRPETLFGTKFEGYLQQPRLGARGDPSRGGTVTSLADQRRKRVYR